MSRIDIAIGIVKDKQGQILISQRAKNVHQGGLWEFPGGKCEQHETIATALIRELKEELDIEVLKAESLIIVNFDYPDCSVCLHVYTILDFLGIAKGGEGQLIKWVTIESLSKYTFPEANQPILSAISLGSDYAIVDSLNAEQLAIDLDRLIKKNISLVQVRMKNLPLIELDKVLQIVDDSSELRVLFNSDMQINRLNQGLHLTSRSLMALTERPKNKLVAASCHNKIELEKAEQLGLDFVVLSPINKTLSHPDAENMGWKAFKQYISTVNLPVFALGGMLLADKNIAISYGGQGIAGISCFK